MCKHLNRNFRDNLSLSKGLKRPSGRIEMEELKPALLTQGEPDVQDLPSTPNKQTLCQGKLGRWEGPLIIAERALNGSLVRKHRLF